MNQTPISTQLAELESRVAFQDQALLELNEALVKHSQLLSRLEARVDDLTRRLRLIEHQADDGGSTLANEPPPPHY